MDVVETEILLNTDALEIAEKIDLICRRYHGACRRLTGRGLGSRESTDRRVAVREPWDIPCILYQALRTSEGAIPLSEQPGQAVTRDISGRGLGLRCDRHLPGDHAIAEFDCPGQGCISLLLEVRWTQRRGLGDHLCGARIIGVLEHGVEIDSAAE